MRRPIIAGNWKLNKTIREAIDLVTGLKRELYKETWLDIVICPPFTALSDVHEVLSESNIQLGGQDIYWEEKGAFTGEVSAPLLKEAGCSHVIIGHSERRQFFHETNETVNKKVRSGLKSGLTPIVCVGENLEERKSGKTLDILKTQVQGSLKGFAQDEASRLVVAYEPVWAIGTGQVATPEQAQEAHQFIRSELNKLFGEKVAQALRIQYGGSVKSDNIASLMQQNDIDGALVGGASLEVQSFSLIVKQAKAVVEAS